MFMCQPAKLSSSTVSRRARHPGPLLRFDERAGQVVVPPLRSRVRCHGLYQWHQRERDPRPGQRGGQLRRQQPGRVPDPDTQQVC